MLDTTDNNKFVAGINADHQHDPGFYTAGPYTALPIIEEALKAIGATPMTRPLSSRQYRVGELSIYARHFADVDIEGRRPILVKPNGS